MDGPLLVATLVIILAQTRTQIRRLLMVMAIIAPALLLSLALPVDGGSQPDHQGGSRSSPTPAPASTTLATDAPSISPTLPPAETPQPTPRASETSAPSTPTPSPATPEPSATLVPVPELTSNTCGTPSSLPITPSTTWTYFVSSDACVYQMRVFSAFRWVEFRDAAAGWYWIYAPVPDASQTVAFEYAGLPWAYSWEGAILEIYQNDWSEPCPDEITPDMWYC